uniref:Uncharacterized protein n=1 Tax=Vespula pensylvanica TaxID=30213 RepID=A0A834NQ06_VESPE|nr:hypothetical protein H0235_012035 [Vespula pensylvanica]
MRNVKSLAMYRWTQDNGGWAVGMLNNWHDFYRNRAWRSYKKGYVFWEWHQSVDRQHRHKSSKIETTCAAAAPAPGYLGAPASLVAAAPAVAYSAHPASLAYTAHAPALAYTAHAAPVAYAAHAAPVAYTAHTSHFAYAAPAVSLVH